MSIDNEGQTTNQKTEAAKNEEAEKLTNPNISTVYSEVCKSYQAIDSFRQMLLGTLPLASGSGIFFLIREKDIYDPSMYMPVGLFGFMVALGLLIFEIHGIRRCTHLIALGTSLETKMGIQGQFRNRPQGLQSVDNSAESDLQPSGKKNSLLQRIINRLFPYLNERLFPYINEPLASGVIYPAALGGWIFLAFCSICPSYIAPLLSITVFCIGFYAMWEFNIWLVDKDSVSKLKELEINKVKKTENDRYKASNEA